MFDNMLTTVLITYACHMIVFFIGFYIARYRNSLFIFRVISLLTSISIILVYIFLRYQPTWFTQRPLLVYTLSGYDISLSLKFIELSFGFPWTYVQKMPFRFILMFLVASPYVPKTEEKLTELLQQDVRDEAYSAIKHGLIQVLLHRIIIYFTPIEWLTLPLSSSHFIIYYFRYLLVCFIFYLSIDIASNLGFSFYWLAFNIRMKPTFPLFPFISLSVRDFWSHRWNSMVQSILHRFSFVIIPQFIEMNNIVKGFLAFILSGFIHEYALWFIDCKIFGKNMMFFILQNIFILIEIMIKLPVQPTSPIDKIKGWLWSFGTLLITSPLFFNPLIESGVLADMK